MTNDASSPAVPLPFGMDTAEAKEVWARLAFAAARTDIAISVWDSDDRLVYTNARFRRMFSKFGPFEGKPHYSSFHDRALRVFQDKPAIRAAIDERMGQRRTRPESGEFMSAQNRMLRYHDIRTPDGGMVSVYEDVTREHSAEATLSAVAKTIPGAIFELRRAPSGRLTCTYMSDRIQELTGLAPEVYTSDWEAAVAALVDGVDARRLYPDGTDEWAADVPIRRSDGAARWLRAQASVRHLRDGTVVWSGLLTDATEAVKGNVALTESERRFRDIIDIASDWVWETDAEDRLTFLSDRFAEISGMPTDQIIGHTRRDLPCYDWDDPGLLALEEDIRERRPIHARRFRINTPTSDRQVAIRGRPVFDDTGSFLGYRGTGTDVTREHEYIQRLRAAMLEAQSANRAKSRFLANMSHDLRTPLNAIMGFSEIMQAEVFGPVGHPRYAEYVRDVRASAAHLLELIDDLLDLARIEAGRIEMASERLAIAELVEEAMTLVEPRCEARNISLSMTCSTDAPIVHSDRRAVKQILVNLLTNAAKFTARGGSIVVEITPDAADGIWIAVRDDGCGIPATMIDEVTKPFVQASQPASRPRDGFGLGLAIVRSLSEAIGAEFRIESRIGEGTTAAVRLPSDCAMQAA